MSVDAAPAAQAELTRPPGRLPRPETATMDVLQRWLGPLEGRQILDAGCGNGALAAALTKRGAHVTGIDPQAEAIATARARLPQSRFEQAGSEAVPFTDNSFDAVVLLNSFHHVPLDLMRAALRECARVSRGPVLIIEPLAEGPFFLCMQPVEDETDIRAAAQIALAEAAAEGEVRVLNIGEYDDVRRFADSDAFLARVVQVDPARAESAVREKDKVTDLVARYATIVEGGIALPQPHRAHLLTRPS
ncbi:class I SAM-dependent methyltransferase [Xanthobacter sp. TB0139]|uniref:class I SAM-dependent methyltransferase n=1 Tax=Xanthobacter sp. TB0139 TaxID=3459178 RepID=UPI004039881A